jgi:uncharacterized membrane protein YuzA (DUF378 family)
MNTNQERARPLHNIALTLVIIGAINWLLVGLFRFDLVASIFGGQDAGASRVVYTIVGIAGIIVAATGYSLPRTTTSATGTGAPTAGTR